MPARRLMLMVAVATLSTSHGAHGDIVSIDRFVPHVSTVPANQGEQVGLFLHEKLSTDYSDTLADGDSAEGRVVLFVHGLSVPSVPDFDLDFKDYSWMASLANAGFDTFAMDHTGYGHSPRPMMNDPCNMAPEDRSIIATGVPRDCTPTYRYTLTSSQSDWDEIDTVVEFIRRLRGVHRVSLIGWSLGGLRTGGYAARHPKKVDKLVLYAPLYLPNVPSDPQNPFPQPGPALGLQTREALLDERWGSNVACENQVEPGIMDVVWRTIMGFDSYGSAWLPGKGVMRVRSATYWGWNPKFAAQITAPTMILIGEQDGLLPGAQALYDDMKGADDKVLVRMACATHFAVWETSQYRFMHDASRQWLMSGTFKGQSKGRYTAAAASRD